LSLKCDVIYNCFKHIVQNSWIVSLLNYGGLSQSNGEWYQKQPVVWGAVRKNNISDRFSTKTAISAQR